LVLETKGQDSGQNQTKRRFLDEWVNAVNEHGGFGRWSRDVSRDPRISLPGTAGLKPRNHAQTECSYLMDYEVDFGKGLDNFKRCNCML